MKAKIRQCVVFSVLVLLAMKALAQDLPTAKPEDVGFSSERLAYIDAFLTERVSHGDLAGIVTLISRHGKVVHFSAIGYADLEKQRKMEKDTIFRQYSMTKAIASTALMTLYEQGRFQMRDPISKYLPEFANIRVLRTPDSPLDETVAPERPPSIHDIFRHTAGFSHGLTTNALDTQYAKSDPFWRRRQPQGDDGAPVQVTASIPAGHEVRLQRWTRCAGSARRSPLRHAF